MVQQTEQNIGQMPSEGDIDAKNTTGQTGVIASMRVFWPWIAPHKKQIILALLSILLVAVALLSLGRGIALLVDSGFGQGEETLLRRAIMICVGITALLAVGSYMRTVLINRVAERVISDIRKAMYRHMIGLSTSWFENRRRGDLISTFSTDTYHDSINTGIQHVHGCPKYAVVGGWSDYGCPDLAQIDTGYSGGGAIGGCAAGCYWPYVAAAITDCTRQNC
jgi:hypothetical protein